MQASQKQQLGVTLLEVLLVMVIAMTIIYLSLQQYVAYKRYGDIQQVQANVDIVFTALSKYFQANCRSSPFNTNAFPNNVSVDINTLISSGYLTTGQLALSPLVNPDQSYIAQLNKLQIDRTIQTCPQGKISPTTGNCNVALVNANVGKQSLWQAQVSVRLQNPSTAEQYLRLLSGDCLSSATAAWGYTFVTPCTNNTGAGEYVVFMRSPYYSANGAPSNYWMSTPLVRQFMQMYTTDPVSVLTNPTDAQLSAQYYICTTGPSNFCGGGVTCP